MTVLLDRLRSAASLAARVGAEKGPVYLVGGFLRDAMLDRSSQDLDLACPGPVLPMARKAAKSLSGRLVTLDAEREVYRIVLRERPFTQVDIARIEGRDILDDLGRRDFTVNAMALEVSSAFSFQLSALKKRLIDPFGGLKDLKAKRIRMVSPRVFREDGLRLLRAFRFAAELDFKIESKTLATIRSERLCIQGIAGERMQFELLRLFETPRSAAALIEMDRSGFMTAMLPELEPLRDCAHVYYGEGGVLKHTLSVVGRLEHLLPNLSKRVPGLSEQIAEHLQNRSYPSASYGAILKLTALLHDIAKPATARMIEGRLRFFGHEEEGGRMAGEVMERLRFSRDHRRIAATIIRYHLRPGNLAANPVVSDKAMYHFFSDVGTEGVGLLLLCWADYASYLTDRQLKKVLSLLNAGPILGPLPPQADRRVQSLGPALLKTYRHLQVARLLLHAYFARKETLSPPRILDGNDVMKILGMKPGPKVGEILARIREAQAEGRIADRPQAIAHLKSLPRA